MSAFGQDSRTYVPALDGMRAGCVLLVCISHLGLGRVVPGGFGVTVFFFISGALITGQLAAERARTRRIDFRAFYVRRLLRLAPAALAYIVIAGALFVRFGGRIPALGWFWAVMHGANYYDLFAGYDNAGTDVRHPFGILWSLAVEEHFYLLIPPLLGLLRRRQAVWLLAGICVVEIAWRAALFHACADPGFPLCGWRVDDRLYKATDARLDSLAWGALLALVPAVRFARATFAAAIAIALLALGFLVPSPWFREVLRYSAQGAALFVLVPVIIRNDCWPRRLLETAPAVLIGRMSYSMYLWHWGALMIADRLFAPESPGWAGLAVGLTAALSALSFFLIERPMLRLRHRFGSKAPAGLAPASLAAPDAPHRLAA